MKRFAATLFAFILVIGFSGEVLSENKIPESGVNFPVIKLKLPENSGHRSYLGLSGTETFSIPEIKADVVIVQIFSMYCPHCQREAPNVNRLFDSLTKNPAVNEKVKLIGIGAGNSAYEVSVFQKKYQIRFPLFEDADFTIHQQIGEVRTPYFFGIKIDGSKTPKVFFSKLGGFENAESFLNEIVKLSGIK
ncbi:MAG: TlpA disulfide reductase family protein [Pseudomonadota bacterium]